MATESNLADLQNQVSGLGINSLHHLLLNIESLPLKSRIATQLHDADSSLSLIIRNRVAEFTTKLLVESKLTRRDSKPNFDDLRTEHADAIRLTRYNNEPFGLDDTENCIAAEWEAISALTRLLQEQKGSLDSEVLPWLRKAAQ